MRVETSYFGPIEVEDNQIISFPDGLLGFEDHQEFLLLDIPNKKIKCLQSVSDELVAFVVASPWDYYPDYEFDMQDAEFESIEATGPEDLAVFSILTLGETLASTTINLLAPVIINASKRLGFQLVLRTDEYGTKMALGPKEVSGADSD